MALRFTIWTLLMELQPAGIPMPSQQGVVLMITLNRWRFPVSLKMMMMKVQVGEGGSLLGEDVVGHMVNEHLAEQLGEVYRSAYPFPKLT